MGQTTGISWAHATYNPWRGCVKVSPGCKFCYAEVQSRRNPKTLGYWGADRPRVVGAEAYFNLPQTLEAKAVRTGERQRLFTCSFADFFEQFEGPMVGTGGEQLFVSPGGKWITKDKDQAGNVLLRPLTMDDVRERVLAQIEMTPHVDWLILTKRAKAIMPTLRRIANSPETFCEMGRDVARRWLDGDYPVNAWVGVSAENQQQMWLRAEELKVVPAAVRFISAEPLLGPIDIAPFCDALTERDRGFGFYQHHPACADEECPRTCRGEGYPEALAGAVPEPDAFHWVIVGGESGSPNDARACRLEWIRKLVEECQFFGVAVFVKQLGTNPDSEVPDDLIQLELMKADKGDEPHEWPEDLRIQEFPKVDLPE